MTSQTLTERGEIADETAGGRVVHRLVFLTDLDDPEQVSSSHELDGLDEVRFRRGDRAMERDGQSLVLAFPDPRMSREHGRLVRNHDRWVIEDTTSKNGVIVDGAATRRAVLADRTLLELGRTCLWYAATRVEASPAYLGGDVDARSLPRWPAAMATFAPALARTFEDVARLAPLPAPLLLLGETGTGKELVARAIHELSGRRGEMVAVNCGALASTLLESELFGHRRGAFSGAVAERRGLIRSADGGTLFLDEIGEIPIASQPAFLRVLQEHEVTPVGDDRPVAVDLRVIAATLRDLTDAVDAGTFRGDLYARIAGHVVVLPPLRERREDLGLLLAAFRARLGGGLPRLSRAAFRAIVVHAWPRNIRELEQALNTAAGLVTGDRIELAHLPAAVRSRSGPTETTPPAPSPSPELDDLDRELRARLVALFTEHSGNVVTVAQALGKQRQQIYRWVKRFAIDLSEFRS